MYTHTATYYRMYVLDMRVKSKEKNKNKTRT